ncbi:MAG: phosphoenolpyruvate--protein phosphotransferase [Rhodobacteraceae bacterium]|nr:phosphoenolpyruvate--protein phosphotransferase [Paracoccaceae bacterium]
MADITGSGSRNLLQRLRETLADGGKGQERLDRITHLIADAMAAEVCSIYLLRDPETLELCATEGLNPESVHQTRLRIGEGLVGRIAREAKPIITPNATRERGFRYMPETGEEIYSSFLGVPIQRLGEMRGVLVVQNREAREYTDDEAYGLEVVAMVIAEMAELGVFVGEGAALSAPHQQALLFRGGIAQEGNAEGRVILHDPRIVIANPIADDPEVELKRLHDAMDILKGDVDDMLNLHAGGGTSEEHRQVLEAYRMFANSRGWQARMEEDIRQGLAAEVAVEKEQSATRARMARVPDAYLRERLHDLDDLSNKLLRLLTGQGSGSGTEMPDNPILVARNIGPGELLEYGNRLKGIVLEEGSVGSHATIVARALAIPLVIHAAKITREALNGDPILVDGDQGIVHLRPEETVATAFRDKIAMQEEAQQKYRSIRNKPATTQDGVTIGLQMNAGLIAELPSLEPSGADGVGLFRTELQFLARPNVPRRGALAEQYDRILNAAAGKRIVFRTLDIGSDKVLPYMKRQDEPNPAMGWRAIRLALDKSGVMRMQLQALLRAANGRPLTVMFPFIAQFDEFREARRRLLAEVEREKALGHNVPSKLEIGAMLETPSLAFAPDQFFEMADFISIGGNDLKQFFFAADRENERVRRRYDSLNVSYLTFIEQIARRCDALGTPVSFCGEDAGRPTEALCLAAMGIRTLSMRPASIGPVKHLLRRVDLSEARAVIDMARSSGAQSVRASVEHYLSTL